MTYTLWSSDMPHIIIIILWICIILVLTVWAATVSDVILAEGQNDLYFIVQ